MDYEKTTTRSSRDAAFDAFSFLLPTAESTNLLCACLNEGEPARLAWAQWIERAKYPETLFKEDARGLKGLLPFIESAVRRNTLTVDKSLETYLRVARVREDLRNDIYVRILAEVLCAASARDIRVIVLAGKALADISYRDSGARHNHGIDLLVDEHDVDAVAGILSGLQCKPSMTTASGSRELTFEHESGLPLSIQDRLFSLPHYPAPLAEIRGRSIPWVIAGSATRTLSPADQLLYICGHAAHSTSRMNLCWACDAWFLIQQFSEADWQILLDVTSKSGLALPLYVMLRYLADELNAPVPLSCLDRLAGAAAHADARELEAAFVAAPTDMRSLARLLNRFRAQTRIQAHLLKFALLPSPTYMRWRHPSRRAWLLPFLYVRRPLWFVARRVGCHLPRLDAPQRT